MDTRLRIIIVISLISLALLAIAWNMSNKIAQLHPNTANAQDLGEDWSSL
jgi:hypothetical protein